MTSERTYDPGTDAAHFLASYDTPVQGHRSLVDEARLVITRTDRR